MKRHAVILLYLILFAMHSRAQQPVTGLFVEAPAVSTEISLDVPL